MCLIPTWGLEVTSDLNPADCVASMSFHRNVHTLSPASTIVIFMSSFRATSSIRYRFSLLTSLSHCFLIQSTACSSVFTSTSLAFNQPAAMNILQSGSLTSSWHDTGVMLVPGCLFISAICFSYNSLARLNSTKSLVGTCRSRGASTQAMTVCWTALGLVHAIPLCLLPYICTPQIH